MNNDLLLLIYMRFSIVVLILISSSFQVFSEGEMNLGITWTGESIMSDQVTEGALEVFNDLVPDLRVEVIPELTSESELKKITDRFSIEKDAMVVLRSSGARFLVENPQSIPSFIGATNSPMELGVTTNLERPGGNITGVTYQIDYLSIFSFYQQIKKDMESILLIFENNHPGSIIDRYHTEKACNELSINYRDTGCTTKEDIIDAVNDNKKSERTIVFANQALFTQYADVIKKAIAGSACFSYNLNLVQSGTLASMSADNFKLGRVLAGSIISVLYGGKRIGDIPIEADNDPVIAINIKTAEELGITIPIHILKIAEVYR
jgi:putative tryptophan/tyrosine transport system substrate-binding protein